MTYRNKELHESLRAYVSVALQTLQKLAEGKVLKIRVISNHKWVKQEEDNTFVRRSQLAPDWESIFMDAEKELKGLPEYKRCIDEIQKDEVIAKHLNTVVGTPVLRGLVQETNVIDGFAIRVLNKQNDFKFNDEIFDHEYFKMEDAFYSPTISCEMMVLLPGFSADVFPVELDDEMKIDILTDEENIECLEHGVIVAQLSGTFSKGPMFAVRIKYQYAKVIGEQNNEAASKESSRERSIEERLFDVIHALRVFKSGDCSYSAILRYSPSWLIKGISYWQPLGIMAPAWFTKYSLSKTETEDFRRFWNAFQSENLKNRKFLDIALRRFSYANERSRSEDKIIDLLIAAEALFLTDSGDAKERGEMRFRLALRAALFSDVISKKNVYDHMRYAYDIRSTIVHGGKPVLRKQDETLEEFVKNTTEYLRTALHKAIDLAAQSKLPKGSLAEWDSMIFPNAEIKETEKT